MILRGALDGLSAVAPIGDPDYAALHGELALQFDGAHPALALDSFFGLNPAMPNFARLYGAKQAIAVHACATNYRERSHFDGQDVLESGMPGPGQVQSGWLNRAIAALPKGERVARGGGLAVGTTPPLVLRGAAPMLGWAPSGLAAPTGDLTARLMDLYAHRDPILAAALQAGVDADHMATKQGMDAMKPGGDVALAMRKAAEGAARLIGADDGPRIAALAFDGWDTHVNEGGATGRLAQLLGGLDGAIAAFETELGPALEGYGRRRRHRIRAHRPYQRHHRHRSRHRHGGVPRRRRAQRRARHRRLAGPARPPTSMRTATSSRRPICAPC